MGMGGDGIGLHGRSGAFDNDCGRDCGRRSKTGFFETGVSCDSPFLPPPLRRAEDSNNTYRLGLSWFWDSSGLGGGGREVVGLDPVAADATRTPVMMFVELASLWRWAGRTGESLALP